MKVSRPVLLTLATSPCWRPSERRAIVALGEATGRGHDGLGRWRHPGRALAADAANLRRGAQGFAIRETSKSASRPAAKPFVVERYWRGEGTRRDVEPSGRAAIAQAKDYDGRDFPKRLCLRKFNHRNRSREVNARREPAA